MKYIDLAGTIIEDLHLTESEASGADAAMRWLHMHTDQVPGRTITEIELREAVENSSRWTDEGFGRDVLSHFGIEVVPPHDRTTSEEKP